MEGGSIPSDGRRNDQRLAKSKDQTKGRRSFSGPFHVDIAFSVRVLWFFCWCSKRGPSLDGRGERAGKNIKLRGNKRYDLHSHFTTCGLFSVYFFNKSIFEYFYSWYHICSFLRPIQSHHLKEYL